MDDLCEDWMAKCQREEPSDEAEKEKESEQEPETEDVYFCSICLEDLTNPAFIETCFHAFCLDCIVKWFQVSRQCPLCKASFSTLIDGSRMKKINLLEPFYGGKSEKGISSGDNQRRALQKRRLVYSRKLCCKGIGTNPYKRNRTIMGEQCQTLFSDQSNQWKERILPWIDRELMVLLGPDCQTSTIYTVRTYLQSLVQRHGIRSSETVKNLTPFLYENTDRFLHELNAFCQSSLSLEDYDKYVQYARELPDQALKDAKESRDELYRILREV